ncbi:TAGAP protein, partial [Amia calva]|nr:TAGAP protein [Amia calva]
RENTPCPVSVDQCPFVLGLTSENAELILDECVQVTEGMLTKDRHLFLFSDVLVIAKLKSNTSYRLKHKVNLNELLLASCEDEIDAINIDPRTSFVVAWPITLCVVSFRSPEVKERWLDTLHWKIKQAKQKERPRTPTTSILMKVLSGSIATKTLSGGNMDSIIEPNFDGDAKTYLPPAPCDAEEGTCQVIEGNKKRKKVLSWPFQRRSFTLSNSSNRSDPDLKTPLFGQPLSIICDEDEKLPKTIMDILTRLLKDGVSTEGIFRKGGNAKTCKEMKEQLNNGQEVDMKSTSIFSLAALFKDFLRHIPNSLLLTELYQSWMAALDKENIEDQYRELKLVIDKLPRPNILLLQHFLSVLNQISRKAEDNKMDAKNLAVCIAPNMLLLDNSLSLEVQKEMTEKITNLTQFLIENCCEIFEDILTLFTDVSEDELGDNSDTLSSIQHDSAYDSTDPDADGDLGDLARKQHVEADEIDQEQAYANPHSSVCEAIASCTSTDIFETFTKRINRRSSEPNILPSGGMKTLKLNRSQDDFSVQKQDMRFEGQLLKKQSSDDSFLMKHLKDKRPPPSLKLSSSLTMEISKTPSSQASSTCSLESSLSNVSETSVFTSSPLASPSSPRKFVFTRHQSFTSKAAEDSERQDKESKRHSQSFCVRNDKKVLLKAKSWSSYNFSKISLKRESQKEKQFSCHTLPEDSQNETEPADPKPRPRPVSAIEVFQQVDSKIPSKPPSYEQAVQNGTSPAPPEYRCMTVQDARKLSIDRKPRPSSVTEELLYTCPVNTYSDCFPQDSGSVDAAPVMVGQSSVFRQRAMSESVSRSRLERVSRRCSQPLFEEISYAKESYV